MMMLWGSVSSEKLDLVRNSICFFFSFLSGEKRFKSDGYEEFNGVDMAPFFSRQFFFLSLHRCNLQR